jgi:plasmid stabilization system protein ParE
MRVKLLEQAKSDLLELARHYQEIGGNTLARKMVARIKQPVLSLGNNPDIAPRYELAPGIRRLVVADGAFLVFYRLHADVEVLHIRRAERLPVTAGDLHKTKT